MSMMKTDLHLKYEAGYIHPLACDVCGAVFTIKSSLTRHKHIHSQEKRFVCDVCGKAFGVNRYLRRHMVHQHTQKRYKCAHCEESFVGKSDLVNHQKQHAGARSKFLKGPASSGGVCCESFTKRQGLIKHESRHAREASLAPKVPSLALSEIQMGDSLHLGLTFTCHLCRKEFASKRNLVFHLGKKHFKCSKCSRVLTNRREIKRHMIRHSGSQEAMRINMTLTMDSGGVSFKTETEFLPNFPLDGESYYNRLGAQPGLRHYVSKTFSCDMCGYSTPAKYLLTTHLGVHLGVKRFMCEECGKTFSWADSLKSHKVTHQKEAPFQCSLCCKSFKLKSYLTQHETYYHFGRGEFFCSLCDKMLLSKFSLKEHMRLHVNSETFACKICGLACPSQYYLTKHKLVHVSNNNPNRCPICKKCFLCKWKLDLHSRVHSGDKPYRCMQCNRSFSDRSSVRKHLKLHIGKKSFRCLTCCKSFAEKYHLTYHLSTHKHLKCVAAVGNKSTDASSS